MEQVFRVCDSDYIAQRCIDKVLGLSRNEVNEQKYDSIVEHCTDVCKERLAEEISESPYPDMFEKPVLNNDGSITVETTDEVGQYCAESCTERECYGQELPKEIAENLDKGYEACYADPHRNEDEDVPEVHACMESYNLTLENFIENTIDKLVGEQADYVKNNPNEFLG